MSLVGVILVVIGIVLVRRERNKLMEKLGSADSFR
ncbi:hypothetical protein SAMN06265379_101185 [Saccharicrinis carchari]|uniref:Uncharacterized protein n=1 Tax=Saccharicrinis carchari TaxID=1168039 RepID=A0A521AJI0_SACCC|nr:hypothetical protein SAMN06265379_101185 [Saccharicrinis carchari]